MAFIAYKIMHRGSGKAYIGVTTQKRHELRWHYHKTLARPGIGKAIQKYGAEAFVFEVIGCATNLDDLIAFEMLLIEQENTIAPNGYNLNGGGKGHFKVHAAVRKALAARNKARVWSAESRAKLSATNTGMKMPQSHRDKTSLRMKAQKPTVETRKKFSEAAKLRVQTPNWKNAMDRYNRTRPVTADLKAKIATGVARYYAARTHDPNQMELL